MQQNTFGCRAQLVYPLGEHISSPSPPSGNGGLLLRAVREGEGDEGKGGERKQPISKGRGREDGRQNAGERGWKGNSP